MPLSLLVASRCPLGISILLCVVMIHAQGILGLHAQSGQEISEGGAVSCPAGAGSDHSSTCLKEVRTGRDLAHDPMPVVLQDQTSALPAPVNGTYRRVHFSDALIGSSIGAAVGVPLGILMIRAARNDSAWRERENRGSDCCALQRGGLGMLGVVFLVGGSPFGAVKGIDRQAPSLYAASVSGELILAGLGYGIGATFGSTDDERLVRGLAGAIPCAAVGAAVGAFLGVHEMGLGQRRGMVQIREGRWDLSIPTVSVQPALGTDRVVSVHISLLSATL